MSQSSPLREEKLRVLVEDIDCLVENDGYFNKLAMTKLLEDFLTSHSTELLKKIEEEIVEIRKIWESYDEYEKIINIAKIETLEKVINLINQEK